MRVVHASVLAAIIVGSVWVGACGSKKDEPPKHHRPAPLPPVEPDPEPTQVTVPDFPDSTHSLELIRTVGVRLEPGDDAKRIGTVAIDTRVGWGRTAKAKGCQKPWVEIRPRGWICADYVRASTRAPFGREVPILDRGELVPGVYGKVTLPNSVTFTFEKPDPKKKDKKRDREKRGPVVSPSQVDGAPKEPKLIESKPLVGSVNVRQYEELTVACSGGSRRRIPSTCCAARSRRTGRRATAGRGSAMTPAGRCRSRSCGRGSTAGSRCTRSTSRSAAASTAS
jgi:hypothetical protein